MDSCLERLSHELEATLSSATLENLQRAPAGTWSGAEILEHLFLTYKSTNRGIARVLEKGGPLATRATFQQRITAFLVFGLGHFPSGRKAPERVVPCGLPVEEVREVIFAEIQQMESGLNDCERRFGASTKIMDHPILGPLSVDEWRTLHWLHGRHHAQQIRERSGIG